MLDYKSIDEKIITGYEYIMKRNTVNACDVWLDAWQGVKAAITEAQINDIK